MTRKKYVLGGAVIVIALATLVVTGIRQSVVYFVTPSELAAAQDKNSGKVYRLGGMVVKGSLKADPATREHHFQLGDGKTSVPVHFRGIPPDLFGDGRGAVVEGRLDADGTFQATTIMAKHSEDYHPPREGAVSAQDLAKTLRPGEGSSPAGSGSSARP